MMVRLAFICLFGLAGAAGATEAVPAQGAAGLVTARDAAALAATVQALGYRAELSVDGAGDPMIVSGVGGLNSGIYFFGCTDGAECRNVLLRIGFDMPNGSKVEVMDAWNREGLMGKAYLDDEGDPILEQFIVLDGGVTRDNLAQSLRWWESAVGDFKKHIGF